MTKQMNYVSLWGKAKRISRWANAPILRAVQQLPQYFGDNVCVGECIDRPLDVSQDPTPTPKPFMPILGTRNDGMFNRKKRQVRGVVLIENLDDEPTIVLCAGIKIMDVIATAKIADGLQQGPYGTNLESELLDQVRLYQAAPGDPGRRFQFKTQPAFRLWGA